MAPRQQIIKINNIEGIIDKINKFVLYYAKIRNQSHWVYSTKYEFLYQIDFHTVAYLNTVCELHQIDYEREFYHANFDYVYNNSPFIQKVPTMRHVLDSFVKLYYPEYLQIEEFIKKMLYSYPTKLEEQDFNNLNDLYNKIKMDGCSNPKSMGQHLQ